MISAGKAIGEHLAHAADHTVTIQVHGQQAFTRTHPASRFSTFYLINVETHPGIPPDQADAVTIQVQHDGIAGAQGGGIVPGANGTPAACVPLVGAVHSTSVGDRGVAAAGAIIKVHVKLPLADHSHLVTAQRNLLVVQNLSGGTGGVPYPRLVDKTVKVLSRGCNITYRQCGGVGAQGRVGGVGDARIRTVDVKLLVVSTCLEGAGHMGPSVQGDAVSLDCDLFIAIVGVEHG